MASPVAGSIVGGKFRLERLVARGGMGAVWQATHLQLDAPVAIKFMDASFASDPQARTRFEREAKAAVQLRNRHVVQIFDHGLDGDTPYIVMELLEGEDLGHRLRKQRRLPVSEVARILTQTAKGLQKAHDLGIIHRDLKPGNVFLAHSDDGETAKILDFGVAKSSRVNTSDGDVTKSGQLLGSPSYMSPEQARGDRLVDHRSDLWSLAVIAFRALTGKKPFEGDAMGAIILAICTTSPPPASQIAPDLPPEIDAFFRKALARDPHSRFQSAREMAAAFATIAGEGELSTDASSTSTPFVQIQRSAVDPPTPSASRGGQTPALPDEPPPVSAPPIGSTISIVEVSDIPPPKRPQRTWLWLTAVMLAAGAAAGLLVWPRLNVRSPAGQAETEVTADLSAQSAPASLTSSDPVVVPEPRPEAPLASAAPAAAAGSASAPAASAPRPVRGSAAQPRPKVGSAPPDPTAPPASSNKRSWGF